MAIYRGDGGSVEGITEADILLIAISQGGTGATTAADARTNLGLGTAATAASSDYATAAQGALAESAIQAGDLATVATTGSYNDLTDLPTAGSGTVTSVAMTVPTGLAVSGSPVTTTGTLAVTYDTGYAIPTTAKQTEWDAAYSDRLKWDGGSTGLTAATGRTSLGLGTAATTAATDYATAAQGTKADTAYGWGNHALAGYLTSETYTGTVTSVAMSVPTGLSISGSPVTSSGTLALTFTTGYSIPTTTKQTNWDTAYGWGNHASAGYLTSETYTGTVTSVGGTGTVNGLTLTGTVTSSGSLTLGGTLDLSSPPTIGGTTAAAITGTVVTASTKFVSSYFDASGSGGGALRNASGTAQLQWGGGGGNNITFDVAANLNPANSQIDISPTGTGTVRINPATLSSMNNVTIGATTPAAGTFTTLKVGSSSILGNANADITLGLAVRNSGASTGYIQTYNSNAGTDLKTWRMGGNGSGDFVVETVNDAYSSSTQRFKIDSSGNLTASSFSGTIDGGTY